MPAEALKSFLDEQGVAYSVVPHAQTFTAQRTAQATHIKGREMAKVLVVKVDGTMCLCVIPAPEHLDLEKVQAAAGAGEVILATEAEFEGQFPGCETGAMPPFGNLYGMSVFVDSLLTRDEHIAFNAGTHSECIMMSYADFTNVVNPVTADLVA
jgi:Ala-tRNA(Pro) deacylase